MATEVIERGEGRGFTTDERGVKTFAREWIVNSDTVINEDQALSAINAVDPSSILWASHPAWPQALLRNHTGKGSSKLGRVWTIGANYSTAPFAASGNGGLAGLGSEGSETTPGEGSSSLTPANERPPTITIDDKEFTKILERDIVTGDRVVNVPLGQPFDPQPEVIRLGELITFTFYRKPDELNWGERRLFKNSINDAPVTILGAVYETHSLRCAKYTLRTVWDTGDSGLELFYELTMQAEYDPDLWTVEILNTSRLDENGNAFVDGNGQPLAEPVPIDDLGVRVPPGSEDYHYVEPNGYFPKDWTEILA